ncbi:DHA2 family efflux MFS transporter permease subunit [Terribacillus saccharophilus]|uniref:Drug resistance transporter, EmrB/QacA subfamily n=1 Tax=Terribacillus saccharophilus TaxID=361277 RepID=A0AAX2EKF9_9BACI|nr:MULTISPECIES: DHA2 family efflux MFS transporter permease subunit [Terribacillus]MCM3227628.1 DHA2 family efflux MFS transporter permease subunit [Terribacillus saccharophilus]MEC0282540.1 DHA2 family efflux MFS transporter permease subunit [Terribacillus saccharophilus]MEC0292314.1 DHA2 family efflux MFS transporter permease subunit [Terribacillus saccharophilus]SEO19281.1 drug resistance transporter, EmrB/QacA subfamily [Terribacillus saccharophilus]
MKDRSAYVSPETLTRGPIVAILVLGAFVAILNQTLMNIALPVMMEDLDIQENSAQWLTTAFMLVNGILIPITAFFMERFTTRKLFITAMSLFAIGTLICGVGPDFTTILIGRIVQAAGAGIMMPLLFNTVLSLYPIEKRGSAMGVIGLAMMFAPAIGPTLSGFVVEHVSWRWLFFIILPIAIIDIILAVFILRNVTKTQKSTVDVLSVILSTIGFGGLLYGFSVAGDKGWDSAPVISTLVVGGISLIIFIIRQLTIKKPMLEFRVFKYWMFSLSTSINVVITMAMFAAMLLIPIFTQNMLGYSPLKSGLLLLPGALVSAIMSPITGKLFDKIGARPLALIGLLITTITTYFLSTLTIDTTYTYMMTVYTFRMIGVSMVMMPIMTAGLNQLPKRYYAHGTAMANTLRQMAGAIGTALLVTVFSTQSKEHVTDMITSGTPQQQATLLGSIEGINDAFWIATLIAGVGFILSFFLKKVRPADEIEQEQSTATTTPVGKPSETH